MESCERGRRGSGLAVQRRGDCSAIFQTEGGIPSTFTPSNSSMNTPAPPSNPLYRMVVKSEDGRELRAFNFKEEDESSCRQPPQEIEWHRRKLVTKPRMSQHGVRNLHVRDVCPCEEGVSASIYSTKLQPKRVLVKPFSNSN
ncbi:hypothetical protein P8452_16394 [Trifolium repens]|nr:hypothetical protein P8452_16394 [Trifolium repens]